MYGTNIANKISPAKYCIYKQVLLFWRFLQFAILAGKLAEEAHKGEGAEEVKKAENAVSWWCLNPVDWPMYKVMDLLRTTHREGERGAERV